jgi:serine/threonine-protein kinase
MVESPASANGTLGRYAIYEEIGAGGMATVHLGRLTGPANFARTVAIKRLHAHLARQPEFVTMFLDEARLAARVRHRNVVATLDIVTASVQPYLVMEYVQGESLARLQSAARQRGERIPPAVACSIVAGILHGLHAAHEATNERGETLGIVHRDVSPQNVMVGVDGVARVLDFGVAKAAGRLQTTREGRLKGKLAYTAPELVRGTAIARTADVYSAAVVLWEMLAGDRLFAGDNEANILERVLFADVGPPSRGAKDVPPELDAIVLQALARNPARRFATAREMARAIESTIPIASPSEVGDWVETLAQQSLLERAEKTARIEGGAATPIDDGVDVLDRVEDIAAGTGVDGPGRQGVTGESDVGPSEDAVQAGAHRNWRPLAYALAAIAVGGTGLRILSHRGEARGSPPVAITAEAPRPVLEPAPPAPASADAPPVAAGVAFAPPEAPAPPRRPAVDGPPKNASGPTRVRSVHAAPAKPSCDPPWTLDDGVKKYKLECL